MVFIKNLESQDNILEYLNKDFKKFKGLIIMTKNLKRELTSLKNCIKDFYYKYSYTPLQVVLPMLLLSHGQVITGTISF